MTSIVRVCTQARLRCIDYEKEEQNAFKRAAQDVHELAPDYDDPAGCSGRLGLCDRQESRVYHERIHPDISGNCRRPVLL